MATRASDYYEATAIRLWTEGRITSLEINPDDERDSINRINSAMESAKREYRRRESESLLAASKSVLSD